MSARERGHPARPVIPFAGDGVVEELGPDRCRLVLGPLVLAGLAAGHGRFEVDIEVVGPDELPPAFAHLACRYTAATAT